MGPLVTAAALLFLVIQPDPTASNASTTPLVQVTTLPRTDPLERSPWGTSPSGTGPSGTSPLIRASPLGTSPLGTSPLGTSPSGASPSGTSPQPIGMTAVSYLSKSFRMTARTMPRADSIPKMSLIGAISTSTNPKKDDKATATSTLTIPETSTVKTTDSSKSTISSILTSRFTSTASSTSAAPSSSTAFSTSAASSTSANFSKSTATSTSTSASMSSVASTSTAGSTSTAASTDSTTSTDSSTESDSESVHPHFPSDLEQRLESLHCSLPLLPPKSRLWRGNQTHEINLPIKSEASSKSTGSSGWSGNAQLQSGDVLLVRIDTQPLLAGNDTSKSDAAAAVYSVSQEALRSCEVSRGILLDISPVMLDARIILALYDKDLADGDNYLAVVSPGWTTERCVQLQVTIKSDNCGEDQACSGNGLCYSLDTMEGYECHCCRGFMGLHCEERDLCQPSPCLNNGICVDVGRLDVNQVAQSPESLFHCLCPYGYTGERCEEPTNPCTSSPCVHGGTCSHNGTAFTCACPDGLSGTQCEHRRPASSVILPTSPCGDIGCVHGVCVRKDASTSCFCEPGYGGPACDLEYDECASNPCENGATCEDLVDAFLCRCRPGYEGPTCNIKIDPCGRFPCSSGEICKPVGTHYECHPRSDFESPCNVNRCQHGGTCINAQSSFFCMCPSGFTGRTCNNTAVRWGEVQTDTPEVAAAPPPRLLVPPHSMYFAVATLAFSVLIVVVTLGVYHCRVNQTYKKCMKMPCGNESIEPQRLLTAKPWGGGGSGGGGIVGYAGSPLCQSRSLHDISDIYYAVDLSDSQTSPLIT